jgi:hypothetical protein
MEDQIKAEPTKMVTVQCITDLRPWATVDGKDLRPLLNDEVATIPRHEAEPMSRRRHVVIINGR